MKQGGTRHPIVIAHRGASGYVPEHTLAAYFIAVQQGADYIEPDLVSTRDAVLVARHENEIGGTSDVAEHPQFAARRTTKVVDGQSIEGWFTEDFTLAELKTLRACERIPHLRPGNVRFNRQFEIPTFDEILALAAGLTDQRARAARERGVAAPPPIGVYPETKHPSYFAERGLALEEPLLAALSRQGYAHADAPIFIQSFEVANLRALRRRSPLALVQLIAANGAPYDFTLSGSPRTYQDLLTREGLAELAREVDAIGVDKQLVVPRSADALGSATPLVAMAHDAGLAVHAWTFRAENEFLPLPLRSSADPSALGDLQGELAVYLATGLDGVFVDQPQFGVEARMRRLNPRSAP